MATTDEQKNDRRRLVQELANLIDDASGPDGYWDGADIVSEVASFIEKYGGWKVCDSDGLVYSSSKSTCPFCPPDL